MATSLFRLLRRSYRFPHVLSAARGYATSKDPPPIPPPPPIKPPGPEWIDLGWKDDGTGLGDSYPNYKEFSYQTRDPHEKYFDQQERRHYGEPIHENDDALNVWMPDDCSHVNETPAEMLFHLCLAFGALGLLVFYSEYIYDAPSRDPAVPKPYPYNNLYLELGGDPDKEPTEEELTQRIPRGLYGW